MHNRLIRIRFKKLAKDVIARAWITDHNSVVICINPDDTPEQRKNAVRQALQILGNNETPKAIRIISRQDSGVIVTDELN